MVARKTKANLGRDDRSRFTLLPLSFLDDFFMPSSQHSPYHNLKASTFHGELV